MNSLVIRLRERAYGGKVPDKLSEDAAETIELLESMLEINRTTIRWRDEEVARLKGELQKQAEKLRLQDAAIRAEQTPSFAKSLTKSVKDAERAERMYANWQHYGKDGWGHGVARSVVALEQWVAEIEDRLQQARL